MDVERNGFHEPKQRTLPFSDMPPFNVQIEEALLGCLMRDPDEITVVSQIVHKDDFFRDAHQTVYEVICDLCNAQRGFDFPLVMEELQKRGVYKEIGAEDLFFKFGCDEGKLTYKAIEYAKVVHDHALARSALQVFNTAIKQIYSKKYEVIDLVEGAAQELYGISARHRGDESQTGDDILAEAIQYIDDRMAGKIMGVGTGFAALDRLTDGLQNGEVTVLAARPSNGKTALMMNICARAATRGNICTYVASLEMKGQPLGLRWLSSKSGVSGNRFKETKYLTKQDLAAVVEAQRALMGNMMIVTHRKPKTLDGIRAKARSLKMTHGLGLLAIDYLGKIQGEERKGENRQSEVARISSGLHDLAAELDIPILVLHQLNRQSENREDRRPRMSDLRDSGQIEADADVIMLLHRPDLYNANDRPGEVDLFVAKNRNGGTGSVVFHFEKELTRFSILATDDESECRWESAGE